MTGPRIGSLFTGTGALDLAVMDVFGGEVVWHSQYEPPDKNGKEDTHQYAAKILARHWPDVPNLGDITLVDWRLIRRLYGEIHILIGGFPCTDVSSAGKRAGLTPETRSGLWSHFAHAFAILRPRLVIIENVQGLLSTKAASDLEPCSDCVGDGSGEPSLRALGAVLGDLASLGFDAEWCVLAASEVGAPHPRKRVFIVAWPAAADSADLGHERGRDAWGRRAGSADGDLAPADAGRPGLEVGGVEPDRHELAPVERGCGESAPDTDGFEPERRGVPGVLGSPSSTELGEGNQRERAGHTARDSSEAPADATGNGRDEGRPESARIEGRPDAPERRGAALELRPGFPDIDWGDYAPAIRRWERILGRRAPWPTDVRGRLSPVFTEWMMGLPDGWVTATPGLTRSAMLKALGNGVVRQQAAAALRLLHERACEPTGAPGLEVAA